MQQLDHKSLNSVFPRESSDHFREKPLGAFSDLVSPVISAIVIWLCAVGSLLGAINRGYGELWVTCIVLNIVGLIITYLIIKQIQKLKREELVIGPAGLYADSVLNLTHTTFHEDLFVEWGELRGIVVEYDDKAVGPEMRFYLESPTDGKKYVEYRVVLESYVGGRRRYDRVLPVIESIRKHAGYNVLFSGPGREESDLLPSPTVKVPFPWKCVFKSAPGEKKKTWKF